MSSSSNRPHPCESCGAPIKTWKAKVCRACYYARRPGSTCAGCGVRIKLGRLRCTACNAARRAAASSLNTWGKRPGKTTPPEPVVMVTREAVKTRVRKCEGCGTYKTLGVMTCLRCDGRPTIPWTITEYVEHRVKVAS